MIRLLLGSQNRFPVTIRPNKETSKYIIPQRYLRRPDNRSRRQYNDPGQRYFHISAAIVIECERRNILHFDSV
jgi:hypothetical protein